MDDESRSNETRVPPTVRFYVAGVSVVALIVFCALTIQWGVPNLLEALFFWTLHLAAFSAAIEIPVRGLSRTQSKSSRPLTLSAGFLVLMTAAFATSPSTAVLVALLPVVAFRRNFWQRISAIRLVFNSAQESIYVGAAAWLFAVGPLVARDGVLVNLVSAAVAASVAVYLNALLVGGVVAIERSWSLRRTLQQLAWTVPHSLGFAFAALLVAALYRGLGPAAAAFLLTPLVVLQHARRAKIELDAAYDRTLKAFVRAVELKDPYTSQHSERVAAIAIELHRELGATDTELEHRYYGALLHDIGKVAVSGRILGKSTSLTAEEYEIVKQHPGVGALVTREVDFLSDLEDEILYHHERIDGKGYPSGLSGDDIPFSARVLSVADTFEALTSDRPYRCALSQQEALDEMVRNKGTQLDEVGVEALMRVLKEGCVFPVLSRGEGRVTGEVDIERGVGEG